MRRLYLVRAYRRSLFGESMPTEPSRFLADIPGELVANSGGAGGTRSSKTSRTNKRRDSWDDDDYNQDTAGESGRVFGSGRAGTYGGDGLSKPASATPKWASRTGSYSSPTVPPSPPPIRKSTGAMPQKTPSLPSQPVQKEAQFKPGDKVRQHVDGEGMVL